MPATECNAISTGLLGNTVDFLSRNVVRTGTGSESDFPTNATRSFDFTDEGQTKQGGRFYDHVVPQNPGLLNGLLDVFYLPWRMDGGYYIILEPRGGPDIMMTAMMSGCSTGYVRAADGAVRVCHHNIQAEDMNQAQRRSLAFADAALHPIRYRHDINENRGDINFISQGFGFVFGVRRNAIWTMYWQSIADSRGRNMRTGEVVASFITVIGAGIL